MAAHGEGICGVCGTSNDISADIMAKIREGLQADGIGFQSIQNILYSADSLNLLSDVKTAVLIEQAGTVSYGEIQQELEILQRQGIHILGMMIVE